MRMRTTRFLAVASPLLALASAVVPAHAQQLDLNPPKPNVLLLVDNSGSMERMIDGTLPEATPANACDVSACNVGPTGTTCSWAASPPSAPNRWNTLINSLVGSAVNGYHCIAMPRDQGSSSAFGQEYQIAGVAPYDSGYYLPYHRMVAQDTTTNPGTTIPCTFAPGDLPGATTGSGVGPNGYGAGGTADSFPANAIVNRPYGQVTIDQSASHSMACQFAINNDGVLTAYQDILRFSLMTFDNDPDPGTGVSASAPLSVVNPAFKGMWSYFPYWSGGGAAAPASGNPVGCAGGAQAFEVGARNSAAPPWEGRLVPFPPSSDATSARQTQNQQLRSVLSATRPYGGTPVAGMLQDAMTYLWNDPNGPGDATNGDQYVRNGCRNEYIILLTDGAPNQDMRPNCGSNDNPSVPCPYNMPETTVATLLAGTGGHPSIQTFVVGFAVSSGVDQGGTVVDCTTLNPTGSDCSPPTPALAPCCELQKIAVAGQPPASNPKAFFVNTATDLQGALNTILAKIGQGQTTRTLPTYSSATNDITYTSNSGTSNQATYYASFSPGVPSPTTGSLTSAGTPWTGNIQRQRFLCSQTPPQVPLDPSKGDDFGVDLAAGGTRHFVALLPSSTPALDSAATIRPYAAATIADGLGNYTATQYVDTASGIVGVLTPPALGLTAGAKSCQYTSTLGNGTGWLTDAQCATMLLDFTFGQSFGGGPSGFPFVSRAGTTPLGQALAFGGLYHASPVVVGPPGALLHDDAYDLFRTSAQTTTAGLGSSTPSARDTLIYAATTDGLLHAFWADENTRANNEEWALIPPAVMPQLQSAYPGADQFLLDGTPVVKDVVWDRKQGSTMAIQGAAVNPWHTTLVAGFGPSQLGYYAVDITNPVFSLAAKSATAPAEGTATSPNGPVFLWQLTKVPSTNMHLFGAHGATPAITQVAITESDGAVHEVGVAILPGGWDTAASTPAVAPGCERYAHNKGLTTWGPTSGFVPRADVRCWGTTGKFADAVVGRSVTIVRLDTGEVIASFMRKTDASVGFPSDTLLHANRIIDTPLDSPMTGTPAVYPPQTGSNALKFFIGDIDGTIWRFDISNPDPTQWTGKLFFDLYNQTADTQNSANDWANGQPIALPLTLSLDRQGRVVLHAASGSQDTFDLTGPNFVASLTETVQTVASTTDYHAGVNWWMGSALPSGLPQLPSTTMSVGERVSGPMVVFNNSVFFTTYYAGTIGSSSVCSAGDSRLWQADYINPKDAAATGTGGVVQGNPPGGQPWTDMTTLGVQQGVVVPGVSIQQTTACATVSTAGDQYVPGVNHTSTTSYTAGSFSLVAQTGKSNNSGGVQTVSRALPAPNSATLIDSWAMVTE